MSVNKHTTKYSNDMLFSFFFLQVDASPSSKLQKLLLESRQMIANLEKTAKGNNIKEV